MIHRGLLALVACISFGTATAVAQWFTYPNPSPPRKADGTVNVDAPAPRGADGKPAFSGVWLAGNHLPCPPLLRDDLGNCIEKITIDDPKGYTRPWTVTIPMDHAGDVELLDEMCLENEKFGPKMDQK